LLKDKLKDWFELEVWLRITPIIPNHKVKFPLCTLSRVKWIITDTP
jgi:hypothetical protein